MSANTHSDIMQAHQFLYHVATDPVLSDREYDEFCKAHGLDGSGGSDNWDDYPESIRKLAAQIRHDFDRGT